MISNVLSGDAPNPDDREPGGKWGLPAREGHGMKTLNIPFEDSEYKLVDKLRRDKGDGRRETWRDALLRLAGAANRGR